MQRWSAHVGLVMVTSGLVAFGCGGDDPAISTPTDTDGGARVEETSPVATPETDSPAASAPAPAPDGGPEPDAGPTETAQILAYVFANSPAAAESTPSEIYSYNAAGGAMKITRTGAGLYTVTFAGLTLDGTVALASAYGTQGGLCHWNSSSGEDVKVRCINSAGNPADAKFTLTVFGKGTTGASILGYAHAHDKSSASYTPQASRSNNGVGGGAIEASRGGTGTYTIDFGGLELADIENVQVMPYGDPDARCIVKSWGGSKVKVYCYDLAGVLMDAQYTVLLAGKKPGGTARVVAYAHASESTTASYAPSLSYNEGAGAVTATRSAKGVYSLAFEGQNMNDGAHVQVSAQGQGRRCTVTAWAGTTVDLTCTNAGGTPGDNNYAAIVLE